VLEFSLCQHVSLCNVSAQFHGRRFYRSTIAITAFRALLRKAGRKNPSSVGLEPATSGFRNQQATTLRGCSEIAFNES